MSLPWPIGLIVDALRANFTPNAAPGRALGSGAGGPVFQPSATRPVLVSYTVEIVATASVTGGNDGLVELLADPVNPPTTVRRSARNAFSITLGVGIAFSSTQRWQLTMLVPKGWFCRLRTTGAATMTLVSQEETVL